MLVVILIAMLQAPPDTSAGHWEGVMQRGSATLHVSFDFPASTPDAGTFSAPDLGAIDIPLQHVQHRAHEHWDLVGDTSTTSFDGTRSGDRITGTFTDPAGGGHFTLQRLSASTEKPYTTRDARFNNGAVTLAGTIFVPRGGGKHPAMIFVQGSGSEGRWASAYLADYVARHGIVALTYDKRGAGGSTGDWRTATMQDLVDDARAGIAFLAIEPEVSRTSIGVYGHSQGGALAPAIAAHDRDVKWIIDADGPVGPAYNQDLFRVDTMLDAKYSGSALHDAEALFAEFVDVARSGAPAGSAARARLRDDIAKAGNAPWLNDLGIPGDQSWVWSWYAKTGNWDNTADWAALDVPALVLFGAEDRLVPAQQSIETITAILGSRDSRNLTVHVFAGADHTLHIPPASADGWPRNPPDFPYVLVTFVRSVTS